MNFKVNFSEQREGFSTRFGEVQNVGTTDHDLLTNRCIPDQHCIGSITGLEDALAEKLPARSFVFGTTDGTVYEGSAGAKNAEDIAFVKQVLIEAGTITKIEVEQAYTSRVTADGQNIVDGQKTPVTMIKGSTVRCENLLVYPYPTTSNTTNSGITWTFDEQGAITVNGTSTAISSYYLMNKSSANYLNKAGTYTISMVNGSTSYYLEIERRDIATNKWLWGSPVNGGSYTFTLNEGEYFIVQIRVASGVTANNQKIYVMLNEGSTALPWQPYFTDLKNAKIDSIVSTNADKTKEDVYQLPETLELGEWDSFNPQTGEITRAASEQLVLTGDTSETWGFEKMEKCYRASYANAFSFDMALPNKMVSNLFSNVESYPDYKTPYIGGSNLAPRIWVYLPLDWGITTVEEWKAFLQAQAEAGKPLIVEYQLATPTVKKLEYAHKSYTAYNQGNETAVLENEEFGAIPTITNEYFKVKV